MLCNLWIKYFYFQKLLLKYKYKDKGRGYTNKTIQNMKKSNLSFLLPFLLMMTLILTGVSCKKQTGEELKSEEESQEEKSQIDSESPEKEKQEIDFKSLDKNIQITFAEAQELAKEAGASMDRGEKEASIVKTNETILKTQKAAQLNKIAFDNAPEEYKNSLRARGEVFALFIEKLETMKKECVPLIIEGQRSEENQALIDCFIQKVMPIQNKLDAKVREMYNLLPAK